MNVSYPAPSLPARRLLRPLLFDELRRSFLRKRRRRRRKVNGVASDVLFTALLQSQLVAYPAAPLPPLLFLSPSSSAIPRSSASSFEVHPLLLVVRLKVSRSLLWWKFLSCARPSILSTSHHPVFFPPPPSPTIPPPVLVHSRVLSSGVNSCLRRIACKDRT